MTGSTKHTECHVVCTDIRFSMYLHNEDIKSGLTDVAVESTDRLVIFCSVDEVWRIQVHWPRSCSAGCSASFWEIRMPSSEFTSVGSHPSKDFAHLFVREIKRNDIGWTVQIVVIKQSTLTCFASTHSSRKPVLKSIPSSPFSVTLI
jgi:hypothetical protein